MKLISFENCIEIYWWKALGETSLHDWGRLQGSCELWALGQVAGLNSGSLSYSHRGRYQATALN